ncbi:DNA polymerase I [Candidatus Marinamargulisbacteria bacterium SCGC AG-343-D04]|nr:DNA polymerase I [Candidatus Marinamargulisbacteria bacterium SCGC AG-343-D04]
MRSVLIVDGFSLAFRSFYAYPMTLTSSDGAPINALYGFVTLILAAIESLKPTHVCVFFDTPEPTFRHIQYSQYKANRSEAPDEFKSQVPLIKSFLEDSSIFSFEKPGYEADDLMGSLAVLAEKEGLFTLMFTGDQDSFQCVTDKVCCVMPQRGKAGLREFKRDDVFEKCGVYPEQIIDYKALKGDSSDNIPGVLGVGEKSAVKLLTEFKTLDLIYKNIDKISSESLKKKLVSGKENAFLSYDLARIDVSVDLPFRISELSLDLNWSNIGRFFQAYSFSSLIKRYEHEFSLPSQEGATTVLSVQDFNVKVVDTLSALKSLLPLLKNGFAFDVETTSLCIQDLQLVGISFSCSDDQSYYLPLNTYIKIQKNDQVGSLFADSIHEDVESLESNPYLDLLKGIFEDSSIYKIAHNVKFEYQVLKRYGIHLQGNLWDTMIASFLLHPLEKVGLKDLVLRHFSVSMKSFTDVVPSGGGFQDVPIEEAASYSAADAYYTFALWQRFLPLLKEKNLFDLFSLIESPLSRVLAEMEYAGVSLDVDKINSLRKEFESVQKIMSEQIFSLSGETFNLNSPKQLASVLFDTLELPVIKKTKTGRSTNNSVLESLKEHHEIISCILNYRSNEKLLSTYINSLPYLIHPNTGRVHTSFNQTVAITGRLTSSRPNLQNIPIRTEKGLLLRSVFVPSDSDRYIVSIDYSQIELRLMAHFSEDVAMIKAFCEGNDIHASTASIMFDCSIEEVTKHQRYQAKAVNFGIIYGISAYGLSKNISISRKEAQDMIDDYFKEFPNIRLFIDSVIQKARDNGYVKTDFGRIRPLPNIHSSNRSLRHFDERAAVNTFLQGTAADIMKKAMIHSFRCLHELSLDAMIIIQVHDELVLDVHQKDLNRTINTIKNCMESIVDYRVPLTVDVEFGEDWMDLKRF